MDGFNKMTLNELQEWVTTKRCGLVLISAEGCPPCETLKSDIKKLIELNVLPENCIHEYVFDFHKKSEMTLQSMNLFGFPTLLHFAQNRKVGKMRGHLIPTSGESHVTLEGWLNRNLARQAIDAA